MAALVAVTMTLTATRALPAPVHGDAGPGDGLRRLARQARRRRDGGAAAVRGLGGDRRLHPGDAEPAGFPVPAGGRSRRASCAAATTPRRSTPSTRRPTRRRWPRSDPGVTVQSYRLADGRARARFHGARSSSRARRSARSTSASTRRRCTKVANLMLVLLAILTLVTSAAVAGGTYLLAQRLSGPIRVLRNSLERARATAATTTGSPTRATTNSGELYADFDRTAAALEKRHEHAGCRPQRRQADVARSRALGWSPSRSSSTAARRRRRAPAPRARSRSADDGPVLARDDDFAIVVARAGETAATLAQRYLGDARKGWWIAEDNGERRDPARPGRRDSAAAAQPDRRATPTASRRFPSSATTASAAGASKLTVTPAAFAAQMDYLARNGYHVLPLARLADFPRGQGAAAEEERRHHDRRRLPRDLRHRVSDPEEARLSRDGVPLQRFRRRRRRAHLAADEGDDRAPGSIDIQPHSKTHANLTLRLPDETDARYRERLRREVDAPIDVIQRAPRARRASRTPIRTAT